MSSPEDRSRAKRGKIAPAKLTLPEGGIQGTLGMALKSAVSKSTAAPAVVTYMTTPQVARDLGIPKEEAAQLLCVELDNSSITGAEWELGMRSLGISFAHYPDWDGEKWVY